MSCSPPERRGGPRSRSTGSSQCTGRGGASRVAVHGRTERTLLFKVCISKVHLRREKEAAHAPATLRVAHAAMAWRRPGFVRGRGRAAGERPQGLGTSCPASSARPHWSCSPPEQYGRASGRWHRPHPVHGALRERIGRVRTDRRRGHSFSRSVFRKCTFGAIRRGSRQQRFALLMPHGVATARICAWTR